MKDKTITFIYIFTIIAIMMYSVNVSASEQALGGFNQSEYLEWDRTYNFSIGCLTSIATDTLEYVTVGNSQTESASLSGTTTTYTEVMLTTRNVAPNELYLCGAATVNIPINCTYSNSSRDYYVISNTSAVNISDTLSSCIFSGTTNLTKANYTINDINNTYLDIDFISTANGMILYKWELPSYATAGNGTGNLICTNAIVQQEYSDVNDSYGFGNATILVTAGSAKRVVCVPDIEYQPNVPSGIPVEVTVVSLVLGGAGIYLLRRRYS